MNMIPEKISTRFRIGIIGPGSICVTYGKALKASDTVSLACICGRDTEKGRKTAERFQVPYYTDQEQMYRNEALDGVLICTPTYTHEEMVRRALARRVPVVCEKPLALDAETARRLVAEAADADVPFMVMQVVRFWPEYRALARLIRSGQLGRIKNVYMSRLSSHPDWTVWHRDPEKSGGGLYDLHIHELDFLYSVFGPAETVYAIGDREENGCFNNVSTCLRFSSGVPAVAEGFMDMTGDFPFSASFRVNGERASVVYESRDGAMTLYKADKPGEELEIPRYDPYREETEYFADCVRSKKETALIPGTDVISVLELLDAVKESLVSGKAVRLSRDSGR